MLCKGMSRRHLLKLAGMGAVGVVLAACAPKVVEKEVTRVVKETVIVEAATAVAAPEEGVTMRYWVAWGNYPLAWEGIQALEEYEELIGNNTVELKAGMSTEALLTAVAGGDPPDAVSHPAGQYTEYMARGVLLPLEALVAASTIIKRENFLEGHWNNGYWKGTLYGVPANAGFAGYALIYNARLVEEAGLDPDRPPLLWGECLEWHEALTEFDDAGNLVRVGLDPYDAMGGSVASDNGFFPPMSWGWDWFDEEAGTFDLNNEMMAEAFEVMGEFYRIAGPDNMAGMRQIEGLGMWGGSFKAEAQAMMIDGYWQTGWVAMAKPEVSEHMRASWAPVPASRSGARVQGYGGHWIILFKEAAHAVPAFAIAELVNTHAACDVLFEKWGCLPSLITYMETVDPMTYPGLEFFFRSIDEFTEWHTPARCEITAFVGTQFNELREKVYRDEMTGVEAAEEFQRRCDEEWKAAGFA